MAQRMDPLTQIAALMFARVEDHSTKFYGKVSELNGVLKVPVILAREMVQKYHRSEFPQWIQDKIPPDQQFVQIFKPYEELAKSIIGVDRLPLVLTHRWVDHPETDQATVGYVSDLKACSDRRIIYGNAYYNVRKITQSLADKIKRGKIVDVSIGFLTGYGGGGQYKNQKFNFHQRNFTLNHLATLEHDKGKCSAGLCGLNMDAAVNSASDVRTILKEKSAGELMTTFINFLPGVAETSPEIVQYVTGVRPIYSPDQNIIRAPAGDDTKITEELLMTPEEIIAMQLKVAELSKENQALKASHDSSKIAELEAAKATADAEKAALKNDNEKKAAELAALKETAAADKVKLDAIAAQDKAILVDKLFMVRNKDNKALYKQEDLKAKSLDKLKELEAIHESIGSFVSTDAAKKQVGFTKPPQADSHSGSEATHKVGDAVVDMNQLYDEVAE